MTSNVRMPAVAGRFYPRDADTLRRDVLKYTSPNVSSQIEAIGCIAPHAGYMYSAHVAGAVYSQIEIPDRVIVLCPNHTGMGHPLAIMASTAWQTPLGKVPANPNLAPSLPHRSPAPHENSPPHRSEHGIEV